MTAKYVRHLVSKFLPLLVHPPLASSFGANDSHKKRVSRRSREMGRESFRVLNGDDGAPIRSCLAVPSRNRKDARWKKSRVNWKTAKKSQKERDFKPQYGEVKRSPVIAGQCYLWPPETPIEMGGD